MRGFTIWITGLPASGKTTLSKALAESIRGLGRAVEVLDGDEIRKTISSGLGFSRQDREENIRRVGHVCNLLIRHGVVCVVSLISPYRSARDEVRRILGKFVEVFADCPVEVCMQRDPRGLYRKARAGEIKNVTGVDDPYEAPLKPEVHLFTDRQDLGSCVEAVLVKAQAMGYLE